MPLDAADYERYADYIDEKKSSRLESDRDAFAKRVALQKPTGVVETLLAAVKAESTLADEDQAALSRKIQDMSAERYGVFECELKGGRLESAVGCLAMSEAEFLSELCWPIA